MKDKRQRNDPPSDKEKPDRDLPAPSHPPGTIPPNLLWTVGGITGVAALCLFLKYESPRMLLLLAPELVILVVFSGLIYWCYRMFRYRDLAAVCAEYHPLVATLKERHRPTYVAFVERAMGNIMIARDRAETMRQLLSGEDVAGFERRIADFEKRAESAPTVDERAACTQSLRETREAFKNLERLRDYVNRYEQGKEHLAAQFKNLRVKLQTSALDPDMASANNDNVDELDSIVRDLETLDSVYRKVDGQETENE